MIPPALTADDVAVARLARQGRIPGPIDPGQRVRWWRRSPQAIDAWKAVGR